MGSWAEVDYGRHVVGFWAATEADTGLGSEKGTTSENEPGPLTGVEVAVTVAFVVETVV